MQWMYNNVTLPECSLFRLLLTVHVIAHCSYQWTVYGFASCWYYDVSKPWSMVCNYCCLYFPEIYVVAIHRGADGGGMEGIISHHPDGGKSPKLCEVASLNRIGYLDVQIRQTVSIIANNCSNRVAVACSTRSCSHCLCLQLNRAKSPHSY